MSAHTPGPWSEDDGNVFGADGTHVCSEPGYTGWESGDLLARRNADLLLIEAAPELLSALIEVTGDSWGEMTGSEMGDAITRARAAIAKATGEQS